MGYGQANGVCDARCMTDARLRLLGLGRLDEIIWAWFNSLVMLYSIAQARAQSTQAPV
jgi:hypothetical protein